MDILACFKMVPDLDMLFGSDWTMDSRFQIDTRYVKTMVNPYDESALELLLKLRDSAVNAGIDLELSALTIGSNQADRMLKNLYALQYERAVRVDCDCDIRFNAPLVSGIIERYIRQIKDYPVIVMGEQSSEGNNARTPLLVAERLNIPCITSVTNIRLSAQKGCLDITSRTDTMVIEQTVLPPLVLSIGNVPNSYIRVPTLRDKILYSKKEIEVFKLEDLGLKEQDFEEQNDCELIELFFEKKDSSCIFIKSDSSLEKAAILYEAYLKERVQR